MPGSATYPSTASTTTRITSRIKPRQPATPHPTALFWFLVIVYLISESDWYCKEFSLAAGRQLELHRISDECSSRQCRTGDDSACFALCRDVANHGPARPTRNRTLPI